MALSAENFVNIRTVYGGTAPEETRRALSVERDNENNDQFWFSEKSKSLQNASDKLNGLVDNLLN